MIVVQMHADLCQAPTALKDIYFDCFLRIYFEECYRVIENGEMSLLDGFVAN